MSAEMQTLEDSALSITAQPAAAYLASLNTSVSRNGMESELRKIARLMGAADWREVNWGTLNAANVQALIAKVTESGAAPNTINKTRAALRGVAKAAWRLRMIDTEELGRINDVKSNPGIRELAGRDVASGEIVALMQACAQDSTPAGARDAAMIAIAKGTGCRRAELANMRRESLRLIDDNSAEVKIIGKRNKQRTLYLTNGALRALKDWLGIRGAAPGPMFYAINKGGKVLDGHGLTTTSLDAILIKRAKQAGVKDLDWHDLRRTVAGELLDAGADIVTVAGILGHSDPKTTARYDRRGDRTKRKAATLINVPYFERKGQ